jgi:(p)ppGpp synthase/HD superfamily hydrolase
MYVRGVERALAVALEAHAGQTRKGSRAPYAIHPLHVALIAARWGCDDETLQAALLHDVVEDCPEWPAERLRAEFGPAVAAIVLELTEDKRRSWEERKERAIAAVPTLSERACVVKAADKLHNLATLVEALEHASDRDVVWSRFNGGRARTLAKDRRLVAALARRLPAASARELEQSLAALEALA